MATYPLTPEGVREKQNELFKLEDRELQEMAVNISKDLRAWIFDNFEVSDEQRKLYESIPLYYNLIMGWQACSGIIVRNYVEFLGTETTEVSRQRRLRKIDTEVEVNASYNESDGFSGSVGVTFKC